MTGERILLDTAYVQALLSKRDGYHLAATRLFPRIQRAREVVVTEAVLTEIGNALSSIDRSAATRFIRSCYEHGNIVVVPVDTVLFRKGLDRYAERDDKEWGITDCISFVVMEQRSLVLAATADHHFVQAGFRAMMLGEAPEHSPSPS